MHDKKRALITGGLGFLGSYAIERYQREGYHITVIDNLSSNTIEPNDPLCAECDIVVKDVLECRWDDFKPFDLILHFASPVGPAAILKWSGKMADYILRDVYWAIEGAQKFDCPLVFISTSEIYGYRSKPELLKEEDDKLLVGDFKVRNEYSIAKLLAEIVLSNVAKVSPLRYQIIRPFNISGARQLPTGGFVLPTFVIQALSGQPITVFNSGEQIRAFTYVKDIVEGIYLASLCSENEIWNVGNPANVTTINDLAKRVLRVTGSNSPIVHVDPKLVHGPLYEEAWDKLPDAEKIEQRCGWTPTLGVDPVVEEVVAYWKQRLQAPAEAAKFKATKIIELDSTLQPAAAVEREVPVSKERPQSPERYVRD